MARTAIPITDIGFQAGVSLSPTNADTANGMLFPNNGRVILIVNNGGGSSINVTVDSVADEAGREGDLVEAVAASAEAVLGPFRPNWWNQRSTDIGDVYVDFSDDTSVTVTAVQISL